MAFYEQVINLQNELDDAFISEFKRSLPFNETLFDRWERAKKLGFGDNSSIYDSALVFGEAKVGTNVWIGPNTIIDGSGGLTIGNFCTISVGVHIYSHDNVKQTLTSGKLPIERASVQIGNNVYIAPNVVITKGVNIGSFSVIGAHAFVNKNVPDYSIVMGQPGKIVGSVSFENQTPVFTYNQ
ncbi:MAG: acyltransferase [Ferruginibacter sp.]|nr:acyltransferase [Ferruginibacter sp.]